MHPFSRYDTSVPNIVPLHKQRPIDTIYSPRYLKAFMGFDFPQKYMFKQLYYSTKYLHISVMTNYTLMYCEKNTQ